MTIKQKRMIAAAVLSALAGAISAFGIIGTGAKPVQVITLFAIGFGSGAALVAAIRSGKEAVNKSESVAEEKE